MSLIKIYIMLAPILFIGCAAIKINDTAKEVEIINNIPSEYSCSYLNVVYGTQGNWFTGGWTNNKNLIEGSRNDMINKGANLGGNLIIPDIFHVTNAFLYGASNSTFMGKVYSCIKGAEWVNQIYSKKCFNYQDYDSCWSATWRLAKIGKTKSALRYFEKALKNGWKDWNSLSTDPDIKSIRNNEKFKNLVKKYRR